jgi:hypothetical protein
MSKQTRDDRTSLPSAIEAVLDAVQVPVPAATLRVLAGLSLPDREVTPQALGRVGSYEQESFVRRHSGPRFSWVLHPDGQAASPRIWARGSWRLSRRIITEDVVPGWSVVLANFLVEQMLGEDEQVRMALAGVSMEAAARVLGPIALHPPGTQETWLKLRESLAALQHPTGPASTTGEQDAAAKRLEDSGLTAFSLHFGTRGHGAPLSETMPPRLRIERDGEDGIPFDVMVMRKAGSDHELGREVIAYIQEWGWLVDHLNRNPSFEEYAERWKVDMPTVRARNDRFAQIFPTEETPERIWNLLWSAARGEGFVRLMGLPVIERVTRRTVINTFSNCLISELREQGEVAAEVAHTVTRFEEDEEPPAGREQRRFFALCERARLWSARSLVACGDTTSAAGLLSIESVTEEASAAYVEQELGRYRRELPEGPARDLLLRSQKALRVATTLDSMNPPADTEPFRDGVEWAAKALAQAASKELAELNLIGEARATVKALEVVR